MENVDTGHCTAATCPVAEGFLSAPPSLAGCVVILAAFAVLVPLNFVHGIRHKTPFFSALMIAGLFFELIGYTGHLLLRFDLTGRNYFILNLLGTLVGPSFLTAAIYIVLPHIMAIYGRHLSGLLRPSHVAYVLVCLDVVALALQASGSAYAGGGTSKAEVCHVSSSPS